jgi:glycosyltransferase involved in cell wall biosynthesis
LGQDGFQSDAQRKNDNIGAKRMRVLAIYPAFDLSINEMAMVWKEVCNTRDVQCTVVANARDILKGKASAQQSGGDTHLRINRFPLRERSSRKLHDIAVETSADVIFCGVAHNMDLARRVQSIHKAPIILHTEYFLDDSVFLRRRDHLGVSFLRPLFSRWTRQRLHREADRILCSNPKEFADPRAKRSPYLSYLPWPVAGERAPVGRSSRHLTQVTYVGSLSKGKGAAVLRDFFSALLKQEPDFQLQLVGPAIDATGRSVLDHLQQQYPARVHVRVHCSRHEALQLLSDSLCVFSPGQRFGWGLMLDAWSTGTPIIALTEHFELRDGMNCLLAESTGDFLAAIRKLRNDVSVWETLSAGGQTTLRGHTIGKAADILYHALSSVLPHD